MRALEASDQALSGDPRHSLVGVRAALPCITEGEGEALLELYGRFEICCASIVCHSTLADVPQRLLEQKENKNVACCDSWSHVDIPSGAGGSDRVRQHHSIPGAGGRLHVEPHRSIERNELLVVEHDRQLYSLAALLTRLPDHVLDEIDALVPQSAQETWDLVARRWPLLAKAATSELGNIILGTVTLGSRLPRSSLPFAERAADYREQADKLRRAILEDRP